MNNLGINKSEMAMVCISEEEAQAQERPQTATAEQASWWIPSDPISERRLVAVLVDMAKCVLDHTEQGNDPCQLEAEALVHLPGAELPGSEVPVLDQPRQADGMVSPNNRHRTACNAPTVRP